MPKLQLPYSALIATADQCREADRKTIESFGVDGITLMESAGLQAAFYIANEVDGEAATGIYYCGKGNNGGDALVVARYLAIQHGHTCTIVFPAGRELSPDAERNLQLLIRLKEEGYPIRISDGLAPSDIDQPDYVVDGLLGTGLTSSLRPPIDQAVEEINRSSARIYALDIPSGLHTDRGTPMPVAVRADVTFSFGTRKLGFYLEEGPTHTGMVIPCDLTFPSSAREGVAELLTTELTDRLPSIQRLATHKYSDRVVYIIAGSEGLTGAAIMASRAAWRSGAGAVFLITPRGALPVYEIALPEIIKLPVGGNADHRFGYKHLEEVLDCFDKRPGVLLIGPGIGRDNDTLRFAGTVIESFKGDIVMDADALHAKTDLSIRSEYITIQTPHPGELSVLSGMNLADGFERLQWIRNQTDTNRTYLLSKGNPTLLAASDATYITGYDTRIFSRAGFGDLLSGTIAGNLAVSGQADLSIVWALVDGKHKADLFVEEKGRQPEPAELL